MTKLPFLVALFSILNCSIAFSQLEMKLYTGLADRFGLALEYPLNDNTGIEIGGSFNSLKTDTYFNREFIINSKENNFFLNAKIKRYTKDEFLNTRFFYGGYLRYWQFAKINADVKTWTPDQQDFAAHNDLWLSKREHKISIGALCGVKGKIFKSFTWELTTGAGASPPFLYFYNTTTTQGSRNGKVGPFEAEGGDWFPDGYLNHLSLLGHVSIGYRF